jgi:hypothetical protein
MGVGYRNMPRWQRREIRLWEEEQARKAEQAEQAASEGGDR